MQIRVQKINCNPDSNLGYGNSNAFNLLSLTTGICSCILRSRRSRMNPFSYGGQ